MHSLSPSSQTIDRKDFQHLQEMDERISHHSDDDYGASPVDSLADASIFSPKTKLAIFIAVLFVMLAHWKCEFYLNSFPSTWMIDNLMLYTFFLSLNRKMV